MFKFGKSNVEVDAKKMRVLLNSGSVTSSASEFQLQSDVSATDTTIVANRTPLWPIADGFWVAIDPWTIQCEIRKVTAVSGSTLTVATLTYAHSASDPVLFLDSPTANVKWFGALGDGSTNDSAAIQAAVDNLPSTGGIVYMPGGSYVIGSTILLDPGTTLLGDYGDMWSPSTQIKLANNVNDNMVENRTVGGSDKDINVLNISFFGNRANQTAGSGIIFNKVIRGLIKNCSFDQIEDDGIVLTNGTQIILIDNIRGFNIGRYGIHLDSYDNWVINCDLTTSGGSHVCYVTSANNIIANNNFFIAPWGIFGTVDARKCSVIGNRCDLDTVGGISWNGSTSDIIGNRLQGNTEYGILMGTTAEDCIVADNIIELDHDYGIRIDTDRATVNGNVLRDTTAYGIWLIDCSDVSIIGNIVHAGTGSGKGIILDYSTTALNDIIINSNRVTGFTVGLELEAQTDYITVTDNNLRGNTSSFTNSSTGNNNIICDNQGWVTENSGTATLVNGNTSIAVTHGLSVTPVAGDIMITPMESLGSATEFYINTYTSTQFTINVDADPGADVDFAWKAVVL